MGEFSRREFLGSLFAQKKDKTVIIRPPYNNDESLFQIHCKDCDGMCVSVCEEEIIKLKDDGSPFLDFNKGGCTFCDLCTQSCTKGVLSLVFKKSVITKNVAIDITSCISWQNIICYSCKDICNDGAIDLLGMFRPNINQYCTGCGMCISVCPSKAIEIKE